MQKNWKDKITLSEKVKRIGNYTCQETNMYIFFLDRDPMQYLGYCMGCNSCNISHRLNLMLKKLTCHMSKLTIRVLQISPISLLFLIFTSAAVYTLHPKFEFQKLSLLSSFPLFHQGFSLCLPLPDALLCSFLNPDCASSTAITPPRRFWQEWARSRRITPKSTNLFPPLPPTLCSELF